MYCNKRNFVTSCGIASVLCVVVILSSWPQAFAYALGPPDECGRCSAVVQMTEDHVNGTQSAGLCHMSEGAALSVTITPFDGVCDDGQGGNCDCRPTDSQHGCKFIVSATVDLRNCSSDLRCQQVSWSTSLMTGTKYLPESQCNCTQVGGQGTTKTSLTESPSNYWTMAAKSFYTCCNSGDEYDASGEDDGIRSWFHLWCKLSDGTYSIYYAAALRCGDCDTGE